MPHESLVRIEGALWMVGEPHPFRVVLRLPPSRHRTRRGPADGSRPPPQNAPESSLQRGFGDLGARLTGHPEPTMGSIDARPTAAS